MKRIVLYLALFLMSMQPLLAQEGSLLKDINVTLSNTGFLIHESIAVGNMIYMIADEGNLDSRKGLWKSDGTTQGTVLVKEFTRTEAINVLGLTSSNGFIYLVATVGSGNYHSFIWQSDGTPQGTISFSRGRDLPESQAPPLLRSVNNTLYFTGYSGLMKTDGTAQGTVLLRNNDGWIYQMVNVNGKLFFMSDTFIGGTYNGQDIYESDGTSAGTVVVENKLKPDFKKITLPLVAIGNEVYFRGVITAGGTGLYKASDTSGVTLIKEFEGTPFNLGVMNPTAVGNTLYFSGKNTATGTELWKTDGSTAGTVLVKDINPGAASSEPALFRAVDGQLYFVADDGSHGKELWKSGGTAASTTLVKDIRPGSLGSEIKNLTAVGSKAAFTANDGSGEKLWQSNGTKDGTQVLANVTALQLLNANGTLYFNGNAGDGFELFKSTMVTGGTRPVTDIEKPESIPRGFTQVNGISYFSADDGIHGLELWKTDGSTAGSMLVSDIQSGSNGSSPQQITDVNGTAFFVTSNRSFITGPDPLKQSLWKTGGTAATTMKVKDFSKDDKPQGLINVNGTLFFGVINRSGLQLWKSDGSPAGTQLIKIIPETFEFSPVTLNGQVYFSAYDGINNVELWKSNGTPEGTVLVKDVAFCAECPNVLELTLAGNFIYYIIRDFDKDYDFDGDYDNNRNSRKLLVKSDGTKEGTNVIKELGVEFTSTRLTAVNDLLFFTTVDPGEKEDIFDEQLWRTDGTAQGTYSIATVGSSKGNQYNYYGDDRMAFNGLFYFVADKEKEIWKSDGTPEGTQKITNFGSGTSIDHLTTTGKTLYFTATDGKSGQEIWKIAGTSESAELAYDMTPNGSTLFYALAALNNQLLISADNGMYGAELFQYQDVAVPVINTVRINAGGSAFAASGQRQFNQDQYYTGIDRTSSVASGDILHTNDDELYRSGRCSPSFSYNIPLTNGKVTVILHFAEIWYGVPGKGAGGAGKRQFNVTIENSRKLTNFDIFAAAGGAMRAVQKSIPVTVTDGMLNIDFTSGAADLPRISAIEVVPASQTYQVLADSYVRDGSYSGINYGNQTELDVKNVAGDASRKRSAYVRFQLPQTTAIGSAKLRIYGHNHENSKDIQLHAYGIDDDSWTESGIVKNNAPAASTASLGSVAVNDQYKYYEIDVTSYVKAQQESGNDLLTLLLADPNNRNTRLVFNSKENSVNAPQLIIQPASVSNSAARLSQEEIADNLQVKQESSIYPNPVKEQFTVSLSMQHAGPVSFELISQAGKSYAVRAVGSVRPGEKAEVNISGLTLSTGIYMLKIQSDAATEVIKMLVTE